MVRVDGTRKREDLDTGRGRMDPDPDPASERFDLDAWLEAQYDDRASGPDDTEGAD